MDIFSVLKIDRKSTESEIKRAYHRALAKYHPTNRDFGDSDSFVSLQEIYKQYLVGDYFHNCYRVVQISCRTVDCRCGGTYRVESTGILECEYCSCFIIVEEDCKFLEN